MAWRCTRSRVPAATVSSALRGFRKRGILAPCQQAIHRRHHKKREEGAEQQATDNHPADLLPAFGTGTCRQRQRNGAKYHGTRRHQNRPQPKLGRLDHCPFDVATLFLQLIGKFDNQNACLLYTSPSPRDRTRSRMPSSA